jgi:hypothetical protein
MRSMTRMVAAAAGLLLAAPIVASADTPFPKITADFHHPLDLKAADPPGPGPGCDGTGDYVVTPPRRLDQSALNDPDAVRWPTLDKSEWEQLKDQYQIQPR